MSRLKIKTLREDVPVVWQIVGQTVQRMLKNVKRNRRQPEQYRQELVAGQRGWAFFQASRQSMGSFLFVEISQWLREKIKQASETSPILSAYQILIRSASGL